MTPDHGYRSDPARHDGTLLLAGFESGHPLIGACAALASAVVIIAPGFGWIPERIFHSTPVDLAIVSASDARSEALIKALEKRAIPWAAITTNHDPLQTDRIYKSGASLVLHANTSMEPLLSLARRLLHVTSTHHENNEKHHGQRHFRAGERVYPDPDGWWAVRHGLMFVEVCDHDGNENIIDILGPGDVHHSADTHIHRSSLYAVSDAVIQSLAPERIRTDPDLADRLMRQHSWLIRLALARSERNLETRLLTILGLLAKRCGFRDGRDLVVHPRLTHAQIASFCGTTRATVTRLLNRLKRTGRIHEYIERDGMRSIAITI